LYSISAGEELIDEIQIVSQEKGFAAGTKRKSTPEWKIGGSIAAAACISVRPHPRTRF
jgi:hypothetical protein